MTATTYNTVLRTPYQKSVAEYWNKEKDPVNLRLGDVDGLYHHHYGLGDYDPSVLEGPTTPGTTASSARCTGWRRRRRMSCSTIWAPSQPDDRLLDAGSRPRRHQLHGQPALRLPGGRRHDLGAAGRVRQRPGGAARREPTG